MRPALALLALAGIAVAANPMVYTKSGALMGGTSQNVRGSCVRRR